MMFPLRLMCLFFLAALALPAKADPVVANYETRRVELLRTFEPYLFRDQGPKTIGYDLVIWSALHGCPPAARIERLLSSVRAPTEMFARPPMVRFLLQFGRCLGPSQRDRLVAAIAYPDQMFAHGTLNHAIMSASSYYLLAERYPDLSWKDRAGKPLTSADVSAKYKSLLMGRFRKFMADGFYEQLSPTYAAINLLATLNLAELARDPELREAAESVVIAQIALLRADSLDGALLPPLMRENAPGQATSDPSSNARDILWLYYGGFSAVDGKRWPEPPYAGMLAASNWRPPTPLLAFDPLAAAPFEIRIATPSFGVWDAPTHTETIGSARIEPDFAIGEGDVFPDPGGYNEATVAFRILVRGLEPAGAIECYDPYWHGNEGPDAWDTDRSSPFEQSWRLGREGLLLFDIPARDPYVSPSSQFFARRAQAAAHLPQLAECRFPRRADESHVTAHGFFARYGKVMIALQALGDVKASIEMAPAGKSLSDFGVMKVLGGKLAIHYRVEPAAEFGQDLGKFEAAVAAEHATYDAEAGSAELTVGGRRHAVAYLPPANVGGYLHFAAPEAFDGVASSPSFQWTRGQIKLVTPSGVLVRRVQ